MRLHVLGCVLIVCTAMGCSQSPSEDLTPVQGTVTFEGEPLSGGMIVFTPDPEQGNRGPVSVGKIDADGHYQLKSEEGTPGAVPGWHRVTIAAPARPLALAHSKLHASDGLFPAKYRHPEQSGLRREVRAAETNVFDFELP